MVRLKAQIVAVPLSSCCYFNSTMVRLKEERFGVITLVNINFNSTMVRLKAEVVPDSVVDGRFQFHYGTIKRIFLFALLHPILLFQFHYGTIKSVRCP